MAKNGKKNGVAKKRKKRRNGEEEDNEGGKARLNLLIDAKLKRWAHVYAKNKCTSVTQLVTGFFVELREREKGVNIKQI